ncbi:MAG: carboxynorspermidine decarboxylase [Proteobacteria bacterium]|nr:carboxynorspermidine decarboxylase [Pseudomonadota bacterium]
MKPFHHFPSPCYIVDESLLRQNLEILADVKARSGARILLALKGFSLFHVFPIVAKYLDGVCASGLYEARLGRELLNKEVHTYSPAFRDDEIDEIARHSNHVVFNSAAQFAKYRDRISTSSTDAPSHAPSLGLRVNPECSEVEVALYNPCAPGSRLGMLRSELQQIEKGTYDGLHFHALCEQNADNLQRVLEAFEARFAPFIPGLKWVNFGGGHHITRRDYKRDLLVQLIKRFSDRYGVQVYLEPGEAVALNTGVLIAEVLDIVHNEVDTAILDISCTCHMPDVLEMPYRPEVRGASAPHQKPYTYRLGGVSCLAGDIIGDYSFDAPLQPGTRLVFEDMAHYTIVKTTMFNGIRHPAIGLWNPATQQARIVRDFQFADYKNRMG